jgi:multidrug transporter EmrE-like cation transporter
MRRKNTILSNPYLYLILTVICRSINPLFFKKAAITLDDYTLMAMVSNVFFIISFALFFIRAITWQITLSKLPLAFAYPFMSVAYITMLAGGYFLYDEKVTVFNIIGTIGIILGLVLMTVGKKGGRNA